MQPAEFPRRILVAATGMTPQIVTETVYCLITQRPPFVPTEVHLVTTRAGADHARNLLLPAGLNKLGRLFEDYGPKGASAPTVNFHVTKDAEGRPIEDIRTAADNTAVANAILGLLLKLSQDPQGAIHASIAGGRKTMGFFLGYCMSLLGRPQDRLSHVLVTAALEAHPDFFYPPKEPQVLMLPGNRSVNTADAEVTLADLEFGKFRGGFRTDDLLKGELTYSGAVRALGPISAPPEVAYESDKQQLLVGGRPVDMPPRELAVYLWLCDLRRQDSAVFVERDKTVDVSGFLAWYRRLRPKDKDPKFEATLKRINGLKGKVPVEDFRPWVSDIKRILIGSTGSLAAAEPYLVHRVGQKGGSKYGLFKLAAEAIRLPDPGRVVLGTSAGGDSRRVPTRGD